MGVQQFAGFFCARAAEKRTVDFLDGRVFVGLAELLAAVNGI